MPLKDQSQPSPVCEDSLFRLRQFLRLCGRDQLVQDLEKLIKCGYHGKWKTDQPQSILHATTVSLAALCRAENLPQITKEELERFYRSEWFLTLADQLPYGLSVNDYQTLRERSENRLDPLPEHLPLILNAFLAPPAGERTFRVAVVTLKTKAKDQIAEAEVSYYPTGTAYSREHFNLWIFTDNATNFADTPDLYRFFANWGAIINDKSSIDAGTFLRETEKLHTVSYHAIDNDDEEGRPELFERRIADTPSFETELPLELLQDCTMEELLTYYPEHVMNWPGLSILLVHYGQHLATNAFQYSRVEEFMKRARNLKDTACNRHNMYQWIRLSCRELLGTEHTPEKTKHESAIEQAVLLDGFCVDLDDFLTKHLWDRPKRLQTVTALKPALPLAEVGKGVIHHPIGHFANRVLAAMNGQIIYPPSPIPLGECHPMVARAAHGSEELMPTKGKLEPDRYPTIPREEVIQNHWTDLYNEPLLYVLLQYGATALAKMCPSNMYRRDGIGTSAALAANIRKRQENALKNRAERLGLVTKDMTKVKFQPLIDKVYADFQNEILQANFRNPRKPRAKPGELTLADSQPKTGRRNARRNFSKPSKPTRRQPRRRKSSLELPAIDVNRDADGNILDEPFPDDVFPPESAYRVEIEKRREGKGETRARKPKVLSRTFNPKTAPHFAGNVNIQRDRGHVVEAPAPLVFDDSVTNIQPFYQQPVWGQQQFAYQDPGFNERQLMYEPSGNNYPDPELAAQGAYNYNLGYGAPQGIIGHNNGLQGYVTDSNGFQDQSNPLNSLYRRNSVNTAFIDPALLNDNSQTGHHTPFETPFDENLFLQEIEAFNRLPPLQTSSQHQQSPTSAPYVEVWKTPPGIQTPTNPSRPLEPLLTHHDVAPEDKPFDGPSYNTRSRSQSRSHSRSSSMSSTLSFSKFNADDIPDVELPEGTRMAFTLDAHVEDEKALESEMPYREQHIRRPSDGQLVRRETSKRSAGVAELEDRAGVFKQPPSRRS